MIADDLPAGRELDALVAEKVMGLKVVGLCDAWDPEGSGYSIFPLVNGEAPHGYVRPAYLNHCTCDCKEFIERRTVEHWMQTFPKKSREECEKSVSSLNAEDAAQYAMERAQWQGHISHCLGVVPNYSEDIAAAWDVVGKLLELGHPVTVSCEPNDDQWLCTLMEERPGELAVWGETASLAICRAALRAVG